jgi:catechol 2,3-dioxygenase-like lactoylglutathione lyase family enzyme
VIDHTGIGVKDVARSAAFYDAALGALGMKHVAQMPEDSGRDGVAYGVTHPVFWIDRFHPHSTKNHTAFSAGNRRAVDAFHKAALEAGGTDNGAPGFRDTAQGYPRGNYAAFVLDPDGTMWKPSFAKRKTVDLLPSSAVFRGNDALDGPLWTVKNGIILISHLKCNFANKSIFPPVKANLPFLLDDHLFDDTAADSLSRRFLRGWTIRLHPA